MGKNLKHSEKYWKFGVFWSRKMLTGNSSCIALHRMLSVLKKDLEAEFSLRGLTVRC